MIRLNDISVGYGHRLLLDHVSAHLRPGHLTALVGRNGAGKSTLLRALAGIEPPRSGSIEIGGKEIHTLRPPEKARLVSLVTTERIRVADMSCRDLVALGRAPHTGWAGALSAEDWRIVRASLERTGMADYMDRTLDSMSDGECQRVMIARALAQDTPVMLLDEPTSFLDIPNRYGMCRLLRDVAETEGKCVVFSTHELDIAQRLADEIGFLDPPSLHIVGARSTECAALAGRIFDLGSYL